MKSTSHLDFLAISQQIQLHFCLRQFVLDVSSAFCTVYSLFPLSHYLSITFVVRLFLFALSQISTICPFWYSLVPFLTFLLFLILSNFINNISIHLFALSLLMKVLSIKVKIVYLLNHFSITSLSPVPKIVLDI